MDGAVRRETARAADALRRAQLGDGGSGLLPAKAPRGDMRRTPPLEIVSARYDIWVVKFRGSRPTVSRARIRSSLRTAPIRPANSDTVGAEPPRCRRFRPCIQMRQFSVFRIASVSSMRGGSEGRGRAKSDERGIPTDTTLRRSAGPSLCAHRR